MITSLTLKNIASYDNNSPVTISDIKKVNFFFGFNGSGKSTIAKYLQNIGRDTSLQDPIFSNCSNIGYDNRFHQILTFNEDFIEANFRRSSDLRGVFSLNQTNVTIDQQISLEEQKIQQYEQEKRKYQSKLDSIVEDKRTKTDALLTHCWNQRTTFSTFSKITLAYSGNKQNHFNEVKRVLQNQNLQISTLHELTTRYQTLYEGDLKNIGNNIDAKNYFSIRRIEKQLEPLLNEIIVGNEDVDIAGLIQQLNSRSWVEQGLTYLEPKSNTCPFCQKETIDSELREQFEKYFDETYKRKLSELTRLQEQYRQKTTLFIQNITAIQSQFNPNNVVSNLLISLNKLFNNNISEITYKGTHSNERKLITSISSQKVQLSTIIAEINANNQTYLAADANKRTLTSDIWNYLSSQCQNEIQQYDSREQKYSRISSLASNQRNLYDSKISTSRQSIESLRRQTVNTKDAVDDINTILKNSGFEGFEIAEKDKVNNISRFYLKRLNSTNTNPIFNSLSEGEKNFIAFLYFYQLCIRTDDLQRNGSKKKILVIDDPVSSLDSQALFIVSTLIHSLIQRKADDNKPNRMLFKNDNILQVFLLTHNIYFYKEVTFDKRPICTDYWHYKISKLNNKSSVSGSYNKAILDDYSLMWATIKEVKANLPGNSSLNIMISNSMRRIIESYVSFIGYGRDSWASIVNNNQTTPGYYIKCAFISTINDESHKVAALDSIYYQKIIAENPQTLFDVFAEIFRTIGKEHYEMLMGETL
ncbi:AAA family ATPase [Rhizosphaericola mali]|uniref:AAA family ATPase n=1 Tax=Rhizosphaericola mali TaxID=2545455 RepID=A0A5P2GBM1_9BACT|nr:AAA family ATPase [Rhizosphaericola mali]QES91050.1 AAA family ATPase [Rhizosphaericola mali]